MMDMENKDKKQQVEAYIRFLRNEAVAVAARFNADLLAFEKNYGCRVNIELLTPKMSKRIGRRLILHPLVGAEIAARKGQEMAENEVIDFTAISFLKTGKENGNGTV
jgi:hypothetical protein